MQWGQAKVEVAALRDEIIERVQEGRTLNHIFQEFKSNGRINASRPSFYRCARELLKPRTKRDLQQGLSANTTRRVRASEPQAPRSTQPSSSPDSDPDGPRLVDAAIQRLPVSRDSTPSSSASVVNQDLWDGNLPKTPEASS